MGWCLLVTWCGEIKGRVTHSAVVDVDGVPRSPRWFGFCGFLSWQYGVGGELEKAGIGNGFEPSFSLPGRNWDGRVTLSLFSQQPAGLGSL